MFKGGWSNLAHLEYSKIFLDSPNTLKIIHFEPERRRTFFGHDEVLRNQDGGQDAF